MQYGQRKLQRSMTEMRRSRNGRPSLSRGWESALSGTMTSDLGMFVRLWRKGQLPQRVITIGAGPMPIATDYGWYGAGYHAIPVGIGRGSSAVPLHQGAVTSGAGGSRSPWGRCSGRAAAPRSHPCPPGRCSPRSHWWALGWPRRVPSHPPRRRWACRRSAPH